MDISKSCLGDVFIKVNMKPFSIKLIRNITIIKNYLYSGKSGRSAIFESDLLQPDDVCTNQRFVIVSDSGWNNRFVLKCFSNEIFIVPIYRE